MNNSYLLNDPIKTEDKRNKFNFSVQCKHRTLHEHLKFEGDTLWHFVFAGSWCNNILHRSFVSIHYIKNIISSFQFLVTNVEGMDILASYKF